MSRKSLSLTSIPFFHIAKDRNDFIAISKKFTMPIYSFNSYIADGSKIPAAFISANYMSDKHDI